MLLFFKKFVFPASSLMTIFLGGLHMTWIMKRPPIIVLLVTGRSSIISSRLMYYITISTTTFYLQHIPGTNHFNLCNSLYGDPILGLKTTTQLKVTCGVQRRLSYASLRLRCVTPIEWNSNMEFNKTSRVLLNAWRSITQVKHPTNGNSLIGKTITNKSVVNGKIVATLSCKAL